MKYGKMFTCVIVIVCFMVLSIAVADAGRLDPYWRVHKRQVARAVKKGPSRVNVFIKSSDPELTGEKILENGGRVRSIMGPILTVTLPDNLVEEAANWPEVIHIEVAKPLVPTNDISSGDTNVSMVHAGAELPQGYDGSGVIVGIVDSGIDLNHPAFLDENGESRVMYVWDQADDAGPNPANLDYGTEYDHDDIVAGTTNHEDTVGHGTHVAATAAGRDGAYGGVAPGASIIAVKLKMSDYDDGQSDSLCLADAAWYIASKAMTLGIPGVINISMGATIGAHDGTSLLEEYLDYVTADSNVSIVSSAGNASLPDGVGDFGYGGNHAGFSVTEDLPMGVFIIPVYDSEQYVVDMWEKSDCNTELAVGLFHVDDGFMGEIGPVSHGEEVEDALPDDLGTVGIYRSGAPAPANDNYETLILYEPGDGFSPGAYYFDMVLAGNCSGLNAWTSHASTLTFGSFSDLEWGIQYVSGDNISTVGAPATAGSVIAVGAYATRTSWMDGDSIFQDYSDEYTIDDIAYFSSQGPALNGTVQGQKPNLSAPGAYTISALSADSSPPSEYVIDDTHQAMNGTSMSSPHVAGIVALMLQANPALTPAQVKNYLEGTARQDSFFTTSDIWGYGKADAYAALDAVVADYAPVDDIVNGGDVIGEGDDDEDTGTPSSSPSPGGGTDGGTTTDGASSGGGCQFVTAGNCSGYLYLLFALLSLGPIAVNRRRKR